MQPCPCGLVWGGQPQPPVQTSSLWNSESFRSCPEWGQRPGIFVIGPRKQGGHGACTGCGERRTDGAPRGLRSTSFPVFAKRSYLAAEIGCFCQNERFLRFLLRCQHEPSSPGARPCVWGDSADLWETMAFRKPESAEIWINVGSVYRRPLEVGPL